MPTAYETAIAALSPEMSVLLQEADPGAPANVLNDQFTAADGTLLSAHTADSGDTWTQNASSGTTATITSNRIRATAADTAIYYSSDVPSSANYVVEAKLRCVTNITAFAGVMARLTTGSPWSGYRLIYYGTFNTWFLYSDSAGVANSIGTWAETLGVGDERTIQLKVDGDAITAVIDGIVRIEAFDFAVTATGRGGVTVNSGLGTTGFHLDYVQARPLKSATIADASGHGHTGTVAGEFTLGNDGVAAGEGSLDTKTRPQKGGYATFSGYTPYTTGASRTFVGMTYIDQVASTTDSIPCMFGSFGTAGDASPNVCVMEAVYEGGDGAYTRIHYNSDAAVLGPFGSAIWYHVLPINEWFHYALTIIDNVPVGFQTLELFINGRSKGDADISGDTQVKWHANVGPYVIGTRGQGGAVAANTHGVTGSHGANAVINRILTPAEIEHLADMAGLWEANPPIAEWLPTAIHAAGRGQ